MGKEERWAPLHPREIGAVLADLDSQWWLAGGWALELFADRPLRQHADLDIEIARHEASALAAALPGWDLRLAHAGQLTPWDGASPIEPPVNSLWCRPAPGEPWRFQVMLATVRAGRWHYRRDERISRPLDAIGIDRPGGPRLLAPEIQLLYKSRAPRDKDQFDFDAVVEMLGEERRRWLADALDISDQMHPWRPRLEDVDAP